jgi:carbonic anhydrase/acetyltransferase-like protein (isoleucine patch superfamily)
MAIYSIGRKTPEIHESAFVADTAALIGDVIVDSQSSVWPGAVLRGDNEPIRIGERSNVQEGAVLHADPGFPLLIEAGVSIGHQAMLHGCTVRQGALIGIQAVILNGAVIGRNCLVGAGAVVTEGKQFPDNSLILGATAKAVKELTEDAIAGMRANAADYVERRDLFMNELVRIA